MAETPIERPSPNNDRLLAYVADLELEVDRLRRQSRFLERQATDTLNPTLRLCTGTGEGDPLPTLAEVETTARGLVEVVRDMHDPPGYHPAHDQVVEPFAPAPPTVTPGDPSLDETEVGS